MKKSFLSAAALVLTMGLSAYAQDDYEDYAYDEGVAESAPEGYSEVSDDAELEADASTARSRIDEEKSAKAEAAAASASESSSDFKPLQYGVHLGVGVSGTYGSEEVPVFRGYSVERYGDPFAGFIGVNLDLGGVVSYRINKMFGVNAELNFHFVDYFKESEVWGIEVWDSYYGSYVTEPVDENMITAGISIPVMARLYPTSGSYAELGAQLNLNLVGKFSLDNTDYDYNEDMGDWKVETVGFGVVVGGGVIVTAGTTRMELGARVVVDLTRIEADEPVFDANNESWRPPVEAKGWHVQLVCNFIL